MSKFKKGDIVVFYSERRKNEEKYYPKCGDLFKIKKYYYPKGEVIDQLINLKTNKSYYRCHESLFVTQLEYEVLKYNL